MLLTVCIFPSGGWSRKIGEKMTEKIGEKKI
jgi:hypothetical protein